MSIGKGIAIAAMWGAVAVTAVAAGNAVGAIGLFALAGTLIIGLLA